MPSIARVLKSPAIIGAVNTFLDAAAAAYQDVVDGSAALTPCPPNIDCDGIVHGALESCDGITALTLLPWFFPQLEIILLASSGTTGIITGVLVASAFI